VTFGKIWFLVKDLLAAQASSFEVGFSERIEPFLNQVLYFRFERRIRHYDLLLSLF